MGSFDRGSSGLLSLGYAPVMAIFAAVATLLPVASKFSFRTARQNVIGGLFVRDLDDTSSFHPARRLDAETARTLTPTAKRRILLLYCAKGC